MPLLTKNKKREFLKDSTLDFGLSEKDFFERASAKIAVHFRENIVQQKHD
jgi:hypothetical protein